MTRAITTQFRNEQNKLADWLSYHKEQGFDTFFLYDDHSDDASPEIIEDWSGRNRNVHVVRHLTRTFANEKRYENCLQTDVYEQDMSLHRRIAESFLEGFQEFVALAKSTGGEGFCALLDVDELLVTDECASVVEIVGQEFARAGSSMLYVPSFDVDTRGLSSDLNVFASKQTCYRWTAKQREEFESGAYAHRGKSIVCAEHAFESRIPWTVIHCGGRPGQNAFEEAVPIDSIMNTDAVRLRIHHYRIPVSRGCNAYGELDRRAYARFVGC